MPLPFKPLKDQSILVTGAGGYLGSTILSCLRKLGARAVGSARSRSAILPEPTVYADLEASHSLESLDSSGPYDTVVHCAALLPSNRNDVDLLIANVKMTCNLIEWARMNGIERFCFLSSSSVYGPQSKPCSEDTLPAPSHFYGISKLACEHVVRVSFPDACLLRIAAPYGPKLRLPTVVKRFLEQASRKQLISLLGSGAREQHFVYEEDVAAAVSLAVANGVAGIFNISGDRPVSMIDLAKIVLNLFGRRLEDSLQFSGEDPQEHYRGNFPHDLAKKTFGYQPQLSLEEGLMLCARAWGLL